MCSAPRRAECSKASASATEAAPRIRPAARSARQLGQGRHRVEQGRGRLRRRAAGTLAAAPDAVSTASKLAQGIRCSRSRRWLADRMRATPPPSEHFAAGGVAAFLGERPRDVDEGRRRSAPSVRQRSQRRLPACWESARASERGRDRVERLVELLRRHRLRAPIVGQLRSGLARERQRVRDARRPLRAAHGTARAARDRRCRARADGRRGCRCRPTRRSAARADAGRCVSYQL